MNTLRRAAFITPLLLSLAGLPALLIAPQASAAEPVATTTENRTVGDFQAIGLQGAMDLVVRQGPQVSVQVQADAKLLPLLETVVEGNALQVRWKKDKGSWWSSSKTGPVLVTVVAPRLTGLSAAGSGDIRVEAFSTPSLQIALSGASDARLESLTTDDLGIRVAGSGDVTARGTAGKVKISIAGSGDVRLADLRAEEVTVSIAGSGDAAVHAQKTLRVSIAGSGDVTYTGNPEVKSSVAGSGSVTRK